MTNRPPPVRTDPGSPWVHYSMKKRVTDVLNGVLEFNPDYGVEIVDALVKLRDDIRNYAVFDVSNAVRENGWLLPAYTFPKNREDLAALRVVIRRGFTHDLADLLIKDLNRQLPRLEKQSAPVHDSTTDASFHH